MRALALVGLLLTTAACGLSVDGLGGDLGDDGGGAPPAGDATTSQDANGDRAGQETGAPADAAVEADDAGGLRDGSSDVVAAHPDGGDADAGAVSEAGDASDSGDDGADADASSADRDGGGDASQGDGAGSPESGSPCVTSLPAGWTVALYDAASVSCPATFTEHDVFGTPSVGANACSCDCQVTQDGSCTQGTLTVYGNHDGSNLCGQLVLPATQISSSNCISAGGVATMTASHGQATPLAPQGGSCSSTSVTDPTQVSTPPARYCDVPPGGAEAVCGGAAPAGFAACVVTTGDVACPLNTPFVNSRYVVEDGVTLGCSPCTCTVNTTCSNARLSAFGDVNCFTPPVASIAVDGVCNYSGAPPPPAPPTFTVAVEYTATATTTCAAGTSTGSPTRTNPRTLCCR